MGIYILRNIFKELQNSPFLTIMGDETTDSSNHGQLVIMFQHVTDDMQMTFYMTLYDNMLYDVI